MKTKMSFSDFLKNQKIFLGGGKKHSQQNTQSLMYSITGLENIGSAQQKTWGWHCAFPFKEVSGAKA